MTRTSLLALVALSTCGYSALGATIDLTGTIRDFHYNGTSTPPLAGHADFQNNLGDDRNAVLSALGADGTPQYANGVNPTGTIHGETGFNQWWHAAPGVNLTDSLTLTLNETSPGIFTYDSDNFFPIDNLLGGNQGSSHNYAFTFQLHSTFTYQPGQDFGFSGDDDVWVFINKKLELDLGGVHGEENGSIDLDSLGLVSGQDYDFDFFFAERHETGSNLKISTSIPLRSTPPTGVPEGGQTIAYLVTGLASLATLRRRKSAN